MQSNVLYLALAEYIAGKIKDTNIANIHGLDFIYASRQGTGNFDPIEKLTQAKNLITKHNINGIYYCNDQSSLMASALAEDFGFHNTDFRSNFLCQHKYYTRQATNSPLKYSYLDIDKPKLDFTYPFYLSAPLSAFGNLHFTINNEAELVQVLPDIKKRLPQMNAMFVPLFERYLDLKEFPLATKNIMKVEEIIIKPQLTIEGFIKDNNITFTAIVDTNFFKNNRLIDSFTLPTKLSLSQIEALKQKTTQDITILGLNNTYFNAEYWVDDHNFILIEVNPRPTMVWAQVFSKALNYDIFKNSLELVIGRTPTLTIEPRYAGGQFNFITRRPGLAQDFLDYSKFIKSPVTYKYTTLKPQDPTYNLSQYGCILAQMEIFGDSVADINHQAQQVREDCLLHDDERQLHEL